MLGFYSTDLTFVKKLEEIIHSNLENENFGVNELAHASGISRSQISKRLWTALKKTTTQFIREIRLRRAKELLSLGNFTAAEVAYMVGFGSPAYFNTCFHAHFGYTPGDVLRNGINGKDQDFYLDAVEPSDPVSDNTTNRFYFPHWMLMSRKQLVFRSIGLIILVVVAYFILFAFVKSSFNFSAPLNRSERSISVLPFVNLGKSVENQDFANEITAEIENNLVQIDELRVVLYTPFSELSSEFRDNAKIAKRLNVNYLLTGSLQRDGDHVRIRVQLIDARKNKLLWSEPYNVHYSEIFQVQSRIATEVATELQAVISPKSKNRIDKIPTRNMEAYSYYLKGKYFLNKRSWKDLDKCKDYFEKAIAADPNYAEAYAGMAEYVLTCYHSVKCPVAARAELAAQYVRKALELDNNLADAHAMHGYIIGFYNWEWDTGLKEIQSAVKQNPNSPLTNKYYASLLWNLRMFQESRKFMNIAVQLNPSNPSILNSSARLFIQENKMEDALSECRLIEELDSTYYGVYWTYFNIYVRTGNDYEALKSVQSAMNIFQEDRHHIEKLRKIYDENAMTGVLKYLLKLELEEQEINFFAVARWHIMLGEKDKALDCLEKAFEKKQDAVSNINGLIEYDGLRNNPRFQALLKKMGLAGYQGEVAVTSLKD